MLAPVNNPSAQPYLLRAIHEWCCDHGMTPYMAVSVDASVSVPPEYVNNNEIVLNISPEATSNLRITNEMVQFRARFGGVARDILVPIDRVLAIYGRETGDGLVFPHVMPNSDHSGQSAGAASVAPRSPVAAVRANVPRGDLRLTAVEASKGESGSDGGTDATGESAVSRPEPSGPDSGGAAGKSRPALKRIK